MRHLPYLLLVLFCFAADQLTKSAVEHFLTRGVELTPFLNLIRVYNEGFLFGIGSDWKNPLKVLFYALIPAGLTALFLLLLVKAEGKLQKLAFALVVGGAAGNLFDRLFRGKVVDFIDLHWGDLHYPAFNLADTCITIGLLILIFSTLKPLRGN